ncbi:MAG: hypothetical protein R3B83_01590 [Nitrospirales bacterium]|nr:hypothetical protein [Nitrospirales bacterium]
MEKCWRAVGGGEIFIPYAIEVDGQIIQVFDPCTHIRVGVLEPSRSLIEAKVEKDTRWVLCSLAD